MDGGLSGKDNLELLFCPADIFGKKGGSRAGTQLLPSAGAWPAGLTPVELDRDIPAHSLGMSGPGPGRSSGFIGNRAGSGLVLVHARKQAPDQGRENDRGCYPASQ